jgi:hypothetical protein
MIINTYITPGRQRRDTTDSDPIYDRCCVRPLTPPQLRGVVELVPAGSLPKDGKVIEDLRNYE